MMYRRVLIGVTAGVLARYAMADTFGSIHYAPRQDRLVVTMYYRGTNPDHTFSLKWGPCTERPDHAAREIVAVVLDSQWQDEAKRDFKKTTSFSLADLQCRPAQLTLKTAPRFYYVLQIPAKH
jgi:hypothetical protein